MPSTHDVVHDHIDRDIFLREALARDFASPTALAHWLQRYRDIEGTLDAIVKAVERYDVEARGEIPYRSAWDPLNHANIDQLGEVCLAVLEKSPDVQESLPELHKKVNSDHQEILQIIPSSENITVVFEPDREGDIEGLFEPHAIPKVSHGLHLFSVTPTGDGGPKAPPTSALVTSLLSAGIEVQYVMNAHDDILLFVESEDAPATFRHLNDLARNDLEPQASD